MIDKFQQMAQALQFLRLPAVVLGGASLVFVGSIIFVVDSPTGERFLIPGIVSLLWALSVYAFIETFRVIPARADKSLGFFGRLKRKLSRGWYWLIGIIFVATSAAVLFVSYRLLFVWLS